MKGTVVTIITIAMALITAVCTYGLYAIGMDWTVVAGVGFGMVICTGIVAVIGNDMDEEDRNKEERL